MEIQCIKCKNDYKTEKYSKCPFCDLPSSVNWDFYKKRQAEILSQKYPNKRFKIGYLCICSNCHDCRIIKTEEDSRKLVCQCIKGTLIQTPFTIDQYNKIGFQPMKTLFIKSLSCCKTELEVYRFLEEHMHELKPEKQTYFSSYVTCPYCSSSSTSKISTLSRGLSFGLFGFGSSKVGKQWHCNKCGSDF